MSKTDKTRPYAVQLQDPTLDSYEWHNHADGVCDFETLEAWKHRYNDTDHTVLGSRVRRYSCGLQFHYNQLNKSFKRMMPREWRRRYEVNARRKLRRQCDLALREYNSWGEVETDIEPYYPRHGALLHWAWQE